MSWARRRGAALAVALAVVAPAAAACSGNGSGGHATSVFKVRAGECFLPPKQVKAELTKVDQVPCTKAHTQEAYAIVPFRSSAGETGGDYPGDTALKQFADGACVQHFATYVGRDYQDSSLFFTYLLPSARSWQQAHDRDVICFITTTGSLLRHSVKGAKI